MADVIQKAEPSDHRFPLEKGCGEDAVHKNPVYSYASVTLTTADGETGFGSAFTLGIGNEAVVQIVGLLADRLVGRSCDELLQTWGEVHHTLADDPGLRWLGPHKGVVSLALAAVTNAMFDLWSRRAGKPLWRWLLDLEDAQVLALLDLSWVEDVLPATAVTAILARHRASRQERSKVLEMGYTGYDTSVGWMGFDDATVVTRAKAAFARGFKSFKLKVGMPDLQDDLRRVRLLREAVPGATIMVDANQKWTWPQAEEACRALAELGVHWIEEPTHPDDALGHRRLKDVVRGTADGSTLIACGEHISNRVIFKSFLSAGAMDICQVDAMRVAGVSEFLVVSFMAKQFGVEVIPHVGDMGQLHQHLVLFNHIALGLPARLLEYIPHLKDHFEEPAIVEDGVYKCPQAPGGSMRVIPLQQQP